MVENNRKLENIQADYSGLQAESSKQVHAHKNLATNFFLVFPFFRGESRSTANSKMEIFVTKTNGFQPLTLVKKMSILDSAKVRPLTSDTPLICFILKHTQ